MSAFFRSVPRAESGGMGVLAAGDFFLTPDVDGVASSLIFGVFAP